MKIRNLIIALAFVTALIKPLTSGISAVADTAPQKTNLPNTANTKSGISGPGKAFVGDVLELPKRYQRRPPTGSVVTTGILPPIKPIWDVHIRDTVICLGGDGNYYMTGSTGDNIWDFNNGVELWRSPDLKQWTYMGLVWDVKKDGTWEKEPRLLHGKPTVTAWAPEIHYLKKNYFICLSMAPGGISILKSSTGKPEGPYINANPEGKPLRSNGIDATLFEDEDGTVYFTNGSARSISRMKDDMSGFAETRVVTLENPDHNPTHHAQKCVDRGMNDIGHEGALLFKANGKYYLGAADDYEGPYSSCVAISNNIWGPYTMRHETVPTGGGTGFFKDKAGKWWSTYFGNDGQAPWREMPGLVRIEFASNGQIQVAKEQPDFVLRTLQK